MEKNLHSPEEKKSLSEMKDFEFPIFKTKTEGDSHSFNLTDPQERKDYFYLKAGDEIKKLQDYLKKHSFIAYLLGKKNSGKGTYSQMFREIVGEDLAVHISVGDIVREVEEEIKDEGKKQELLEYLKKNYRGYIPLEETFEALSSRSTKTLLPTEFILALTKREIDKHPKKTLFIDGFPRNLDQISYSLFFRDLAGYRYDPDIFILVDVPEAVIEKRIQYRVVCPVCQTPRNLKLLPTNKVGYDKEKKEFYLICDNPGCQNARMVQKEGDAQGIEPIRERLKLDEQLMRKAFSLYGVSKIFLRNAVPVEVADKYVNDYEITPEFDYRWDPEKEKVEIIKNPWVVLDNEGKPSYSLMPEAVVVSMIKQLVNVLGL